MSDVELEVWIEEVQQMIADEETEGDMKLQELLKPPEQDAMPRTAGMHTRTPSELLPRPSL
jgi:hypothetical protein